MVEDKNHNIEICVCFDDHYFIGALGLFSSLSSRNNNLRVYVLYDSLDKRLRQFVIDYFETIHFEFVRIAITRKIGKIGYFSPSTCGRLYIADYINTSKCIYLDTDIICLNPIEHLYGIDISNGVIAAAQDHYYTKAYQHLKHLPRKLIPVRLYSATGINAGVLIVNLEEWRNRRLTAKTINWITKNREYLILPDQAALNYFVQGDYVVLDKKWNTCVYRSAITSLKDVNILHFTGRRKPWNNIEVKFSNIWWHYARAAVDSIPDELKHRFVDESVLRISTEKADHVVHSGVVSATTTDC